MILLPDGAVFSLPAPPPADASFIAEALPPSDAPPRWRRHDLHCFFCCFQPDAAAAFTPPTAMPHCRHFATTRQIFARCHYGSDARYYHLATPLFSPLTPARCCAPLFARRECRSPSSPPAAAAFTCHFAAAAASAAMLICRHR